MIKELRWSYRFGVLHDIVHPINTARSLFWRVVKIFKWLPVLWNDSDWDWTSILTIHEFKLRSMANAFQGPYAVSMGSERAAKQMLIAAALCKRIREEKYADWKWDVIHELTGEWATEPAGDNAHRLIWPNQKISGEEKRRLVLEASNYEERQRKQDLEYLGLLHRKYLRNWWD